MTSDQTEPDRRPIPGQEALFAGTHARASDPATSKAAAASAFDMAQGHCAAIHTVLERWPRTGLTVSELARHLPHLSRHQINKRLPDLRLQGFAYASATLTRQGETGRSEQVWYPGKDPEPKPKPRTLKERLETIEAALPGILERLERLERAAARGVFDAD